MVDEFQDTNALQCELVDLLAARRAPGRKERLLRRRRVPVDLRLPARGRRGLPRAARGGGAAAAADARTTARGPEVLAAVNHLFEPAFGDGFQPLAASGEFPDPVFGHPVELLVTDKASYAGSGEHWRRAEARPSRGACASSSTRARRAPGEIVLLFAAGTDAEWYEEELRARGPADLPRDRARLLRPAAGRRPAACTCACCATATTTRRSSSVLASPFVGVSNDALVLIRRHTGRRPLFTGHRALAAGGARRARRAASCARSSSATSGSSRRRRACRSSGSASRSCREHDYDLAVLARWDGQRRYANLRKLMRLARSYEELRGRDIEGFVRFIREQEALGAAQLEAVSEEEGADAVRLLTIHAAKGLEFKVVVVADAGRDTGRAAGGRRDPRPLRRPLRLQGRPPGDGRRARPSSATRRCATPGWRPTRRERLRLYYVAMTRAIDRLIVSGAVDERRDTPIGWVLVAARVRRASSRRAAAPFELERGGATFLVRVDRAGARRAEPRAGGRRRGRAARALRRAARRRRRRAATGCRSSCRCPSPPRPPRAAALVLGARALRALLVPLLRRARGGPARAARAVAGCGRARRDRDRRRGAPAARARRPRRRRRRPTSSVVRDVVPGGRRTRSSSGSASFVAAYCESALARRVAALVGARPERPFAFEHDGVLLHGRLDLLHRDGPRALVVDYKTNVLGERDAGRRSSRASTACSGSCTRSRASAPAPRRSRSCTRSSSGPTRSSRRRFARGAGRGARGRAVGGDRADRRGRVRPDARTSSRASAVPRSTSSAPARGCRGGAPARQPRAKPSRPPDGVQRAPRARRLRPRARGRRGRHR